MGGRTTWVGWWSSAMLLRVWLAVASIIVVLRLRTVGGILLLVLLRIRRVRWRRLVVVLGWVLASGRVRLMMLLRRRRVRMLLGGRRVGIMLGRRRVWVVLMRRCVAVLVRCLGVWDGSLM